MSEESGTLGWRVAAASMRGSSHGPGSPNQDAVRYAEVRDADGNEVLVAAVSDGHGGPRYVRSDVGAQVAVQVAVDRLADVVGASSARDWAEVLEEEIPAVVARWRAAVAAHHGAHPFTAEEAERSGGVRLEDHVAVAYGATLLLAIVSDAGVGLAQIGDGDALIRTHGFATRPVPGDARLVAGETTSLCLDTAVDDFRFAALPGTADAELVLLATDGYGNSFAQADWWHALVGDLAWFLSTNGFEDFAARFPEWLGESAMVGGDDVTAVLVARGPRTRVSAGPLDGRVHTLPLPEPPTAEEAPEESFDNPLPARDPGAEPGGGRRRRRGGLAAALAVFLVVAAVILGIVLVGADDSTQDGPGPQPPTTSPAEPETPSPAADDTPRKRGKPPRDQEPGETPGPAKGPVPDEPKAPQPKPAGGLDDA